MPDDRADGHAIKIETKSRFQAKTDSWGNVEPKGGGGHSKLLNTEPQPFAIFTFVKALNMLVFLFLLAMT